MRLNGSYDSHRSESWAGSHFERHLFLLNMLDIKGWDSQLRYISSFCVKQETRAICSTLVALTLAEPEYGQYTLEIQRVLISRHHSSLLASGVIMEGTKSRYFRGTQEGQNV